jgi:hypothetical protein
MAFVSNAPDLEEEKENQTPAQGAVSPISGSGAVHLAPASGVLSAGGGGTNSGGAPSVGGASSAGASAAGAAPQAGGQFGSLNQYLTANQGQAQPLANTITNGINNQYNTLNNQNQSTLSGISQQVSANAAPTQAQTNATIAQESANPVSFANNPGNVANFQNLLNASYAGPASAESTTGYENQQNAINSAISAGNNAVGTEAGRENLLSQNEATPTTGVTALNSAILSQSPQALSSIENAYQPFSGLLTNLQSGASATDQQIAANQANATQDAAAANAAIANQTQGLNTAVNNELTNANDQNQAFTNNYNGLVSGFGVGGNLTPQQINELGITPEQYQALQNQVALAGQSQYMTAPNFGAASTPSQINNDQYLTQESAPAAVTANQVATPQQFQTLMALMSLNGGQAPTGAVLNPNDASQAGTYTAPTLNGIFNYNQALQNAQSTVQAQDAAAQAQANAESAAALAQHNAGGGGLFSKLLTPLGGALAGVVNPIAAIPAEEKEAQKII